MGFTRHDFFCYSKVTPKFNVLSVRYSVYRGNGIYSSVFLWSYIEPMSNLSVCRSVGHTLLDDEFMYLTYSSSDEVTLGRSDLQKETNHRVSNNANR